MAQNFTVAVDLEEACNRLGLHLAESEVKTIFRLIISQQLQAMVTRQLVADCLAEATRELGRQERKTKKRAEGSVPNDETK